jgi:hypothetical protein
MLKSANSATRNDPQGEREHPVTVDVAATEDQECHPRSKAPDHHGHAGNHRRDHIRQI